MKKIFQMSLMTFCFAGVCLNSEAKVNFGIEAKLGVASMNVKKIDVKEIELKTFKDKDKHDVARAGVNNGVLKDLAADGGSTEENDRRKEQFKKIYEYDVYTPVFKYSNGVNKQNNSFAVTVAGSANVELGSDFELGGKVYYTYLAGGKTKIQSTKVGYKADGTVDSSTHYDIVVPIVNVAHESNDDVNPDFISSSKYQIKLGSKVIATNHEYEAATPSALSAFLVYNPVTGTSRLITAYDGNKDNNATVVVRSALVKASSISDPGQNALPILYGESPYMAKGFLKQDTADVDTLFEQKDVIMMYDAAGTISTAAGVNFALGKVNLGGGDKDEFTLDEINAIKPELKEFILKAKEKYAEVLKYNGGTHNIIDETLRVRGMYGFMIDASYKINDKAKVFVGAGFGIPVVKSDTKLKKKLGFAAEFGVSAEVCPSVSIGATYNYNKINLKAKHEEIDKLRKLKGNLHIFSLTFTKTF